jgi:hypothetical protein
VGADQAGEAVVDVGPLLARGDGLEVGGRHLDMELEVALVAEVDYLNSLRMSLRLMRTFD